MDDQETKSTREQAQIDEWNDIFSMTYDTLLEAIAIVQEQEAHDRKIQQSKPIQTKGTEI